MPCTPYAPTPGLFQTNQSLQPLARKTFGEYTLVPTADGFTVQQRGATIYTHRRFSSNHSTRVLLYGSSYRYLLVLDSYNDSVRIDYRLILVDLADKRSPWALLTVQPFTSNQPKVNVQPSQGNGLAVFVWLGTNMVGSKVQQATIYRSDTGQALCTASPWDPSVQVIAEATSTQVKIKDGQRQVAWADLPRGRLSASPSNLAFGRTEPNKTVSRNVTFSNVGKDCLEVTGLSSSAHFRPVNFTPFTLPPGGSQAVTIEFVPGAATGYFSETLTISSNPALGIGQIAVTGESRSVIVPPPPPPPRPYVTVVPTGASFTGVRVGGSAEMALAVTNSGGATLSMSIAGPGDPAFSVVGAPSPQLEPGATGHLRLRFAPSAARSYSDAVVINSNAANPQVRVPLSGDGILGRLSVSAEPTFIPLHQPVQVLIHALDAETRAAVSGTVDVNGQTVGSTGRAFTHTFVPRWVRVFDPETRRWIIEERPPLCTVRADTYQDETVPFDYAWTESAIADRSVAADSEPPQLTT